MMRKLSLLSLAMMSATGLRRSANKVEATSGVSILEASTAPTADGVWTAMSPPNLFSYKNLSFAAPGSKATMFQLEFDDSTAEGFGMMSTAGDDSVRGLSGTDGSAQMTAILQTDKTIAGTIVDPNDGMVHQFVGKDGGDLTFTSIPGDKFPEDGPPVYVDSPDEVDDVAAEGMGIQATSTLDVMVLWTMGSECANAGESTSCSVTTDTMTKMRAKVNLAVKETNDAYAYSGINARLRLVHSYRHPNYTTKGFRTDLSNLQSCSIHGVCNKRTKKAADLVVMITEGREYCGLGYIGPSKNYMFTITAQQCATGYYTFGHEIGHNLGCRHDRGADNKCTSSTSHYGYRDPEGLWRTTMAYACKSDDCMRQPVRGRCTRMKFYSNPNVKYNGKAIGIAGKADNAKQINSVAAKVAAYF